MRICIRSYRPQKQSKSLGEQLNNSHLGDRKSGHCREVAVSGGLTEIEPTVCLREMSIL